MKKKQTKEVRIKKKDKYSDYVLKDSVEKLGAVEVDENDCVMTRSGVRYYVYRLYFETPFDTDEMLNRINKTYLHEMVNVLEHDFKVLFLDEAKNILNENISYFQKLLETSTSQIRRTLLMQEIETMKVMNGVKTTNTILFIHEDDDDILHKTTVGIVLEKLGRPEIEQLFSMLNNEMG